MKPEFCSLNIYNIGINDFSSAKIDINTGFIGDVNSEK